MLTITRGQRTTRSTRLNSVIVKEFVRQKIILEVTKENCILVGLKFCLSSPEVLTEEKKTLFTVYIGYFLDIYGSPSLSFVDTYGKTFFPSESLKLRCQMRIFKQIFQNLKMHKRAVYDSRGGYWGCLVYTPPTN